MGLILSTYSIENFALSGSTAAPTAFTSIAVSPGTPASSRAWITSSALLRRINALIPF